MNDFLKVDTVAGFLWSVGGVWAFVTVLASPFVLREAIRSTRSSNPAWLLLILGALCLLWSVVWYATAAMTGVSLRGWLLAGGLPPMALSVVALWVAGLDRWALARIERAGRASAGYFMARLAIRGLWRESAALGEVALSEEPREPRVILNLAVALAQTGQGTRGLELARSLDRNALTPAHQEAQRLVLQSNSPLRHRRGRRAAVGLLLCGLVALLIFSGGQLFPSFRRLYTTKEGLLAGAVVPAFVAGLFLAKLVLRAVRGDRTSGDVVEVVQMLRAERRAAQAVVVARARLAYSPDDADVQRELSDIERPVQTPSPPPIA